MRPKTILIRASTPLLIACSGTMVRDHDNDLLTPMPTRATVLARRTTGVGKLVAFPAPGATIAVAVEIGAGCCGEHLAGRRDLPEATAAAGAGGVVGDSVGLRKEVSGEMLARRAGMWRLTVVEARFAGCAAALAARKLLSVLGSESGAGERGYEMPLICWVVPTWEICDGGACGALRQSGARMANMRAEVFMMAWADGPSLRWQLWQGVWI